MTLRATKSARQYISKQQLSVRRQQQRQENRNVTAETLARSGALSVSGGKRLASRPLGRKAIKTLCTLD